MYSVPPKKSSIFIHIGLFVLTFITCMAAGTQWAYKDFTEVLHWHYGIEYAILILTFLTAHEFGHYFAARYHKVDATLPYYIPFPIPMAINFGTFGAVIKTRTPIPSRKALFDIGAAGPIAGFVVALGFLLYGLLTLPPIDYLYAIHPEYLTLYGGEIPKTSLHFGDTILYWVLANIFANPDGFLPPMNEIYHYPYLNVGWFGLFVTSLNLVPIGQLDGGHITYAMLGKFHKKVAYFAWIGMLIIGLSGLVKLFYDFLFYEQYEFFLFVMMQNLFVPIFLWIEHYIPILLQGWLGWLLWALIAKFFIKLEHPPVADLSDIGTARKAIGWFCILLFILSFSYNGIYFVE